MADAGETAEKQLREITECPICMNAFTDPRMLPCIHTFCFECLSRTAETAHKKPGDKMPCLLCRKEFKIPADGVNGIQKNFFMENLLELKTKLQIGSTNIRYCACNISKDRNRENISRATKRCLECKDYYCESCSEVHQKQKLSSNHHIITIGNETDEEMKRISAVKSCIKHTQKPLDYYCADCKKIVCVSCFVESHKFHDCKDVTTVDAEFRKMIENNASKISSYADEILSMKRNTEKSKADFLKKMVEKENAIYLRNQDLKNMIDRQTNSLLDELYLIKLHHLQKIENYVEQIDIYYTISRSFEAYCTELRLKGSASEICNSVDDLIVRADELEKDHEAFIGRQHQSVEVSFQSADLTEVLQMVNNNVVGQIKETTTQFENYAVVVGLNDGPCITNEVVKINLHRPNEISTQEQIPTLMAIEAVAAVNSNTMYVAGLGDNLGEIWKYEEASGWKQCTSLVQGRRRHSAAFIDEVLYICGGYADSDGIVLDSIEAYNTITGNNYCTIVGKLIHCVQSSSNCVPYNSLLYLFGGSDQDNNQCSHVQVYNTKENTCALLWKPMPRPYMLMRAVLCNKSIILIGRSTCFIFNIETQTWLERKQFKGDVFHFGLVLESELVFIIGGGIDEKDKDGKMIWKCRDDVRYVPLQGILDDKAVEWKIHGTLPKPCLVQACAKLRFLA